MDDNGILVGDHGIRLEFYWDNHGIFMSMVYANCIHVRPMAYHIIVGREMNIGHHWTYSVNTIGICPIRLYHIVIIIIIYIIAVNGKYEITLFHGEVFLVGFLRFLMGVHQIIQV